MGLTPPQFQVRKCRVTSRLRTRTQEVLNPRPQKHCGAPLQCA
jgi:hypothetical protein